MSIKPWYTVVQPRADLREGQPLDAAEFAVHLDQVRDGRAPSVYQKPEEFFARTYLTQYLLGFSAEVSRRLAGLKTETSAVFNMTTQFGGGKTHALTLLYHLARHGPAAQRWSGVARILDKAGLASVPQAAVAVFVGTEFDVLTGRGGDDGSPQRRTPWGEIAYQLGGEAAFAVVAEHDRLQVAPAGDVIRKFLPADRPALILMDELMNYISRGRKLGVVSQFYDFLQNLSEEVRGQDRVVLVVSIPKSEEIEMTPDDQADFERLKKLLDRVGKAVMMSAEAETSEIIRRRLFEWDELAITQDGRVMLNRDAQETCRAYGDWIDAHRSQIPEWFATDNPRDAYAATYPFHPSLLSVFERKWQALPRFQRTRGILRLLALWVARAYQDGYKGSQREPLITLGTAPFEDPLFRAALFEQLGEARLEAAVTTDIAGKKDAHAVRLDEAAADLLRKARLHRKAATVIFFESNGGQTRTEASVPEVRLGIGEPDQDIGNAEAVLEALAAQCYYLSTERSRYRFSLSPNLNKLLADYRANVKPPAMDERVRSEIGKAFTASKVAGLDLVLFPERSIQIPDKPALALVVLAPDHSLQDDAKTRALVETLTREYGNASRTFKSGLIWAVPDSPSALMDEARKVLALEAIDAEREGLRLDADQGRQLAEAIKKAQRDLREAVWRTYKHLGLLGKENTFRFLDLGLVHSSAADTLVQHYLNQLRQAGDVEDAIHARFLVRNWPPAFREWSTKSARDAFFASPQLPRLLNPDTIRNTIAQGVAAGQLAYVGKAPGGGYAPFIFHQPLSAGEVEIADDVFIITQETAQAYQRAQAAPPPEAEPAGPTITYPEPGQGPSRPAAEPGPMPLVQQPVGLPPETPTTRLSWTGEVPPQKWMNFYTKILSKFMSGKGLRLTVKFDVMPDQGLTAQKIDETRQGLRELGLPDNVEAQ